MEPEEELYFLWWKVGNGLYVATLWLKPVTFHEYYRSHLIYEII